ncbi:MAG TPA: hypothetical protein VGI43_18645, partial [Mucilaginibacter sp.]
MKNIIKGFLVVLCLAATLNASAQSEQATITGTFTKNCNCELTLGSKVDGKYSPIAEYEIGATNTKFCFAIPFHSNSVYELKITTMKREGRHLRPDNSTSFPLNLVANQNLNLTVDPSQMNGAKQTGFVAEQGPPKFQTASISGSLVNIKLNIKFSLDLEKATEGS